MFRIRLEIRADSATELAVTGAAGNADTVDTVSSAIAFVAARSAVISVILQIGAIIATNFLSGWAGNNAAAI